MHNTLILGQMLELLTLVFGEYIYTYTGYQLIPIYIHFKVYHSVHHTRKTQPGECTDTDKSSPFHIKRLLYENELSADPRSLSFRFIFIQLGSHRPRLLCTEAFLRKFCISEGLFSEAGFSVWRRAFPLLKVLRKSLGRRLQAGLALMMCIKQTKVTLATRANMFVWSTVPWSPCCIAAGRSSIERRKIGKCSKMFMKINEFMFHIRYINFTF